MELYGRRIITTGYDESQLDATNIAKIISENMSTHLANATETQYLLDYYKGKQDILNKTKSVRENINNKIVENNAYQIVEFKKGYVFGEPIQYTMRNDSSTEEISTLNDYMNYEDKAKKDTDLAEWLYICGLGYRIVLPDNRDDIDEAPFEIYNLSPINTFVVRTAQIGNKPLFGATYVKVKSGDKDFIVYYVYTKNQYFEYISEYTGGTLGRVDFVKSKPHLLGNIPIIEYSLNANRLGLIEIVKSLLDALNLITSNEMDDIEQYVNSLLVFVNQNVEDAGLTALLAKGAVCINSIDPSRPADIKNINQKLDNGGTKMFYERIFNNMLSIAGIPSKNDKASGGDTGQARLLGEGWTMADERAKQDEQAFKQSEKDMLKLVLTICKGLTASEIKTLTLKNIDIKFTRNKSDNMLVKSQSLQNMLEAGVAPSVAFNVSGLFSDSTDVVTQSMAFYGEDYYKSKNNSSAKVESNTTNPTNTANTAN